jgi:hypothetical protein
MLLTMIFGKIARHAGWKRQKTRAKVPKQSLSQ